MTQTALDLNPVTSAGRNQSGQKKAQEAQEEDGCKNPMTHDGFYAWFITRFGSHDGPLGVLARKLDKEKL